MKDAQGKDIKVGDTVAVAVRRGTRGGLTIGKVLRFFPYRSWARAGQPPLETATISVMMTRVTVTKRHPEGAYRKVESRFERRLFVGETESDRMVVLS